MRQVIEFLAVIMVVSAILRLFHWLQYAYPMAFGWLTLSLLALSPALVLAWRWLWAEYRKDMK